MPLLPADTGCIVKLKHNLPTLILVMKYMHISMLGTGILTDCTATYQMHNDVDLCK